MFICIWRLNEWMNELTLDSSGCSVSQLCGSHYGVLSDPQPPLAGLPILPPTGLFLWMASLATQAQNPCHHFSFPPPSSTHIQTPVHFSDTLASCINSFLSSFLRPPPLLISHLDTVIVSDLGPLPVGPPLQSVLHTAARMRFLLARLDQVSPLLRN